MNVLFLIAIRNLVQARRRTALLSTAIGLVTMLLVLLMAMSQGINDNLVKSATTISAGHINVSGFYKPTASESAPIITDVARIRKIVEENTPGLDYITDRHRSWSKVVSESGAVQSSLSGIDVTQEERFLSTIKLATEDTYKEGGRHEIIGDPRRLSEHNSVMMFAGQAKRLEVGVGDEVTVRTETMSGRSNTADLTIVAVAEDVGLLSSWSMFVPKSTIYELQQLNENTTGAVWVYLKDIDDAPEVMAHLREVFVKEGFEVMDYQPMPFFFKFDTVAGEDWTGQKLDLTIWKDEVSFLTWVLTAFNSITYFLITILVVIIAIGIMNTMWNAVRERTREIGTMRAIGMTRDRVLIMFMIEAGLLGLFATSVGALLGAVVSVVVTSADIEVPIAAMKTILLSDTLTLVVHGGAVASAVALLTFITSLAALWPSLRAAFLRPVTAISHME